MKRQFLCICSIFLSFAMFHPTAVVNAKETTIISSKTQAGWVFTNDHWQYLDKSGERLDGLRKIDGSLYLLLDGNMCTGLVEHDGSKILFGDDGKLIGGLYYQFTRGYYFVNENFEYLTGWQYFNGNWYFFNSDGLLSSN